MKSSITKYEIEVEGTSPILMHKFNGIEEEKAVKQKADKEQAEFHAYRLSNDGNLYIPAEWFKGCLREYLVSQSAPKEKTKTKLEVAPRIQIQPSMIDLGIEEYDIDKRSVPSGNMSRGGVRDFCVRPLLKNWKAKFTLITTLDKSMEQLKKDVENSGIDVGIGSNRINGYWRFKIVALNKV